MQHFPLSPPVQEKQVAANCIINHSVLPRAIHYLLYPLVKLD